MSKALYQKHWTRKDNGDIDDPWFRAELLGDLPALYDNLMAWIAEDAGTGMYRNEIDWAIRDLVDAAVE